ncbi:MAG: AhpC/TSA family protein [Flavobacterium sp.]|nr:MAG: AhpC/TSA family protein [Flavobacterium sp.]
MTFITFLKKHKFAANLFMLLTVSAFLFSCNKNSYTITGTIKGVANGKKITLERQQESLGIMIPVDTANVENGKFAFEGKAQDPAIYQISVEGEKVKAFIILEHGDIKVNMNKDSVFTNDVSGTYNNDQLADFSKQNIAIQKKITEFKRINGPKMVQARKDNDTVTIHALMKEYEVITKEAGDKATTFRNEYISKHPKSLVSLLLIKDLSTAPLADISKLAENFNSLDPELKSSKIGKAIEKKLAELKQVKVGRRAPDFSATDATGKKVSLNESMGKITVIDFWASWCPACRQENPNMVALYNEFHAKGLNIIGVSLDDNANKWKTAIEADKLAWPQVSNLKKWEDPIAVSYGIEALPATYLINQYGLVVATDLRGEKLKERVAQMLK